MKIRFDNEVEIADALKSILECLDTHDMIDKDCKYIYERKVEMINELSIIAKELMNEYELVEM